MHFVSIFIFTLVFNIYYIHVCVCARVCPHTHAYKYSFYWGDVCGLLGAILSTVMYVVFLGAIGFQNY